jgi:hypothetical protein
MAVLALCQELSLAAVKDWATLKGTVIVSGYTGTNVCDIMLYLINNQDQLPVFMIEERKTIG